jgi:hypothetical protein
VTLLEFRQSFPVQVLKSRIELAVDVDLSDRARWWLAFVFFGPDGRYNPHTVELEARDVLALRRDIDTGYQLLCAMSRDKKVQEAGSSTYVGDARSKLRVLVRVGQGAGLYFFDWHGPFGQSEKSVRVFLTALDDLPDRAKVLIDHIRTTYPSPPKPPLPTANEIAMSVPRYRSEGAFSLVLSKARGWSQIGQKLKELLGCDLRDAHRLLDGPPVVVMRTDSKEEAEKVGNELRAAGANIEVVHRAGND